MTLQLVHIGPVQEIAADQPTMDRLVVALDPSTTAAQATPELLAALPAGGLAGFRVPVVVDPAVPSGQVHFRPIRSARQDQ